MNINQLKKLKELGHNIGMHSSSHPTDISKLDQKQQNQEYKENFEFIQNNIGYKPNSMSHPCGIYTKETLQILRSMNIKIGFRSNLNRDFIRSELEIPREDHANLLNSISK